MITNDGEAVPTDTIVTQETCCQELIMWSVEVVYQNRNWKCLEKA